MSTLITDKVDNAAVQKKNWTPVRIYPHTPLAAIFTGLLPVCAMGMAGNLNDILIAQFKRASI